MVSGSVHKKGKVADLTPGALVSWLPLYEVAHPLLEYPASSVRYPDLRPSALLLPSLGVGGGKNRCQGMRQACGFPLPHVCSICTLGESMGRHL